MLQPNSDSVPEGAEQAPARGAEAKGPETAEADVRTKPSSLCLSQSLVSFS